MTVETQIQNLGFLIGMMFLSLVLIWVLVYFIRKVALSGGMPSFAKMANVLGSIASIIVVFVGMIGAFSAAGPRLALDPAMAPPAQEIEETGETPVLIEEVDRRGTWDRGSRLESEQER